MFKDLEQMKEMLELDISQLVKFMRWDKKSFISWRNNPAGTSISQNAVAGYCAMQRFIKASDLFGGQYFVIEPSAIGLKYIRILLRMDHDALAFLLEIPVSKVRNWEYGRCKISFAGDHVPRYMKLRDDAQEYRLKVCKARTSFGLDIDQFYNVFGILNPFDKASFFSWEKFPKETAPEQIKYLRIKQNNTPEHFASMLDVSVSTLYRWEQSAARPTEEYQKKLLAYLKKISPLKPEPRL